jgi:hypothetical protein
VNAVNIKTNYCIFQYRRYGFRLRRGRGAVVFKEESVGIRLSTLLYESHSGQIETESVLSKTMITSESTAEQCNSNKKESNLLLSETSASEFTQRVHSLQERLIGDDLRLMNSENEQQATDAEFNVPALTQKVNNLSTSKS